MGILYPFLLVGCYGFFFHLQVVKGSPSEKRLVDKLLTDYDVSIRPVDDDGQSVNVTFNFALFQLIEINEKNQVIEVAAWTRQKWSDCNLKWNPADYNNISSFNLKSERIWVPDLVLYNNINDANAEFGGNLDTLKTRVIVYNDGTVYWLAPIVIKASCRMNVEEFPFDTQHCKFKIGSWSYDASKLNITTDGFDVDNFPQNLEWNLVRSEGIRSETEYNCCPGVKYPDVTFHVYFQRRSLFYILNLIFPIALITLLTIVVKYFIVCMMMMFIIIVLLCYISRLYNRKATDRPMGSWTRRYILDKLSYLVRIRYPQPGEKRRQKAPTKASESEHRYERNLLTENKNHSNHSNCHESAALRRSNNDEVGDNSTSTIRRDDVLDYFDDCFIDGGDNSCSNSPRISLLKRLSRCPNISRTDALQLELVIREIERKDRARNGGDNNNNNNNNVYDGDNSTPAFEDEWRIVAMTIDRCLFVGFVSTFMVGSVACFASYEFVW